MDIDDLLKKESGIRLDIGCGGHKQKGFVGMDIQPLPGVDIVHDFLSFPWPLPDECCLLAMASHVIEHIPPVWWRDGKTEWPFLRFMDEVWRVLKPEAKFVASMPYAGSRGYWQDPTHVNGCNEVTWLYFDPLNAAGGIEPDGVAMFYKFYRPKPWEVDVNQIFTDQVGNMEVVLRKRREDPVYYG